LSRAIHRFKYGRDVSHARPLADLMTAVLRNVSGYDAIVPVPLHLARLRWRGFNQAVLLARPIARFWRIPLEALALRRSRPTAPQVGLGEAERRRNIAGAFEIRDSAAIRRRRILLIDDVYTTGATVEECSRIVLEGGALAVDVAVVARAI
jgi:ComF family protein